MSNKKPRLKSLPPDTVSQPASQEVQGTQPANVRPAAYPEVELLRYDNPADLNLRGLLRIIRKRRLLILGIVLIATTLVTIETFRIKPLYEATATIEIGPNSDNGIRVGSSDVLIQQEDNLYVTMNTTQIILKSAPLLEDVVDQMRLDQNPVFLDVTQKKSIMESLSDIAGKIQSDRAKAPPAVFTATPVKSKLSGKRPREEEERLAPFVGVLEDSLVVKPIEDTRAMTIAYKHTDPALATSIANAIAARFVETSFDKKVEGFASVSDWLDRSTRELKAKVERSEQALADYTKKNNIYAVEGKETLITEKLSHLHDQATKAETDRILKGSLYDQVLQDHVDQIPEAFADPKIGELQRKLEILAITAAELTVTYGPKYSKVAETNQQMAAIREQIETSRSLLGDKLAADYERADHVEKALKSALTAAKAEATKENQNAIQYSLLKQDVETSKSLYTEFLQKTSQADLQVAQQHSNIRIVAPARVPKSRVSPNRRRNILMGFLVSLFGGVILASLLERLDDSIRNVDDVSRATQLPALAVIPAIAQGRFLNGKRRKALSGEPLGLASEVKLPEVRLPEHIRRARLMEFDGRSPASEAYRALRTGLLLSAAGNPPKTILVTSVRASDGKSTTATNVAISLAQLGASVVLLDCDLRKPTLHDVFSTSRSSGLSTYLVRSVEVDEVIQKLPGENLYMIPGGPCPPNPAELLSSKRMKTLLTQLAERFDHIVIDSPPLGSVTDPVILSTMVDGTILVVDGSRNSRQAVQRACRELSGVGGRIFGIVLNKVDLRREGHDDYYYYSSYQYGDSDNERHAKA